MIVKSLNGITFRRIIQSAYWFAVGFILAGTLLSSAILFYFQHSYKNRVIPGVFVDNTYIGEKTKEEVYEIFSGKNRAIEHTNIRFSALDQTATISAKTLGIGYDTNLIVEQSAGLGKSKSLLTDVYIILSSYINGTFLKSSYSYNERALTTVISPIQKSIYREPIDAQFNVKDNRVSAFQQSVPGQDFDYNALHHKVKDMVPGLLRSGGSSPQHIAIPIKSMEPKVTTEEANNLGIVGVIGVGTSTYAHSIPSRIHNVALAASKINGVLVPPDEEFSFVKSIGDISRYTGYQQAYIISGGKTILGDGGGVCQVSTTIFRAALNAGLPITERYAHAYRVGYYEQDQPPGLDATTYVPTVDFKFKNDTGNHILIQTSVDSVNLALTFTLYGKSDGRISTISKPVISNVSPAPPDLIQDDPTLPVGQMKQIDFAAPGARSVFTRTVTKNGKVIISDTFISNYRPWQAVHLKGTKT